MVAASALGSKLVMKVVCVWDEAIRMTVVPISGVIGTTVVPISGVIGPTVVRRANTTGIGLANTTGIGYQAQDKSKFSYRARFSYSS